VEGRISRAFLPSKDEDARIWQQDFISTFLERDLRKMGIEISPAALRRLWTVCAHYHQNPYLCEVDATHFWEFSSGFEPTNW